MTTTGTGVVPTVRLSWRAACRTPTSSAKRAETATGTGPGSGKAVATRVRAASGGAAELDGRGHPQRGSRRRVGERDGRVAQLARDRRRGGGGPGPSRSVDRSGDGGGRHGDAVTATATRSAGRSVGRDRQGHRDQPQPVGRRAGRQRCARPSSGTGAPVQGVRRPVASCSSSRGVTASGVVAGRGPGQGERGAGRDGDAGGPGRRRERGAHVRPAAVAVQPAAQQRVGAGGVDGDQPRRVAGAAEPLTDGDATVGGRAHRSAGRRADRRALPGDRRRAEGEREVGADGRASAWSCCERCQVASKARPNVPAAQARPIEQAGGDRLRAGGRPRTRPAAAPARGRGAASRSAPRRAGSTRRSASAAPAVSSSAGASTRTASAREPAAVGWACSCHQPTAANATSSRSAPERASSSRAGAPVAGRAGRAGPRGR